MRQLLLIALCCAVPALLPAQSASRWDAFVGCWVSSDDPASPLQTCYLPVDGEPDVVERVSVRGGAVVLRSRMRLGSAPQTIAGEGCSGTESAELSADGARVFMRGQVTCGTMEQGTHGVMALSSRGELMRIYAVTAGDQTALMTERFVPVPQVAVAPELAAMLEAIALRTRGVRVAASRPLSFDQIEDAIGRTSSIVVEAWMVEATRETSGFRAPRAALERLVAMNAPTGVVDMAVIVANPQRFDIAAAGEEPVQVRGGSFSGSPFRVAGGSCFGAGFNTNFADPLAWSPWLLPLGLLPVGPFDNCAAYGYWTRYAFSPFGWSAWYPGSYGGYGAWRRQRQTPIVVVVPGGNGTLTTPERLGRVQRGRGYTAPSSPSGGGSGPAQPREPAGTSIAPTTVRQPATRGESGGGSSSGAAPTRTRTESGSGTGRTAQPRNPRDP